MKNIREVSVVAAGLLIIDLDCTINNIFVDHVIVIAYRFTPLCCQCFIFFLFVIICTFTL